MTNDELFPEQLAEILGASTRTLRRWRRMDEGPKFQRLHGEVFYRLGDVVSWLRQHRPDIAIPQEILDRVAAAKLVASESYTDSQRR